MVKEGNLLSLHDHEWPHFSTFSDEGDLIHESWGSRAMANWFGISDADAHSLFLEPIGRSDRGYAPMRGVIGKFKEIRKRYTATSCRTPEDTIEV